MTRLYVSDLDGTLLDGDARLRPASRAALLRLHAAEVPFTIATARSVVSIRELMAGVPLRLPVVASNGAYVVEVESGEILAVHTVDSDAAYRAIDLARAGRLGPFVSTVAGEYGGMHYERQENEGMGWYIREREEANDPRLKRVEDVRAHVAPGVTCVTLMGREPEIRIAEREMRDRFGDVATLHAFHNWYSPDWWWLTVHGREANKGHALGVLRRLCGLEDHEVVAFGDTEGDIPLFDAADVSIAVRNADPPVRAAADHVIGPNDDDSVVRFVERDVAQRGPNKTGGPDETTREAIRVPTASGAELAVEVYRPAGPPTGAVVMVHGFASSRQSQKGQMLSAVLARAGLTVLCPDLQGHGESDGPFEELTIGRSVSDVRAVADLPAYRDAPRRALIGSSFGGLVTAWAAAEDARLCERLVLIAPALGFLERYLAEQSADAIAAWRSGTPHQIVTPWYEVALGTDILDEQSARTIDTLVSRLTTPTLSIHGTDDVAVPHAVSVDFVAREGPAPRRLRSVPGGDHSLAEHYADLVESVLTFLS